MAFSHNFLQRLFTLMGLFLYITHDAAWSLRLTEDSNAPVRGRTPVPAPLVPSELSHEQSSHIPVSVLKEISKVKSTKEFLRKFLQPTRHGKHNASILPGVARPTAENEDVDEDAVVALESVIFNSEGQVSRAGAQAAASFFSSPGQGCHPKLMSLPVPSDSSPDIFFWPECVDLHRCSGCCGSDLLACQPVEIDVQHLTVIKLRFDPDSLNFELEGTEDISMVDHTSCECGCKVKPHHCKIGKQEYVPDACECRCINEENSHFCHSYQKWNAYECVCECRLHYTCPSGEYFSNTSCQCVKLESISATMEETKDTPDMDCKDSVCEIGYRPVTAGTKCVCRPVQWAVKGISNSTNNESKIKRRRKTHRNLKVSKKSGHRQ